MYLVIGPQESGGQQDHKRLCRVL